MRFALFFVPTLVACTGTEPSVTSSPAPEGGLSIAFQSRIDGEIEPCG